MRYGVFSDIHANLEAFDAVLQAYSGEMIDEYLCVGDIVGYGANPHECVAGVKKLVRVTVAGNHDRASIGQFNTEYFNTAAREAVDWTAGVLAPEDEEYLGSIKLSGIIDDIITLVHGTLIAPEEFRYLLDMASAASSFSLLLNPVCFVGHTHVPFIFWQDPGGVIEYTRKSKITVDEGYRYLINVGSVGQPRDADNRAAYAVYDAEKRTVEIKRAAYDIRGAQNKIISSGLPRILAERLAVGK